MARAVDLFFGLVSANAPPMPCEFWDIAGHLADSQFDLDDQNAGLAAANHWIRGRGAGAAPNRAAAAGDRTSIADEYLGSFRPLGRNMRGGFSTCGARSQLDAVIRPPHALPALRHGSSEHLATAGSYCYWANLLGVPAGVVPVTRVQVDGESDRPESRDVVDRAARGVEAGSAGLPVGCKLAARPWREDIVLAIMGRLEWAMRDMPDYPRTPILPVPTPAP